MPVQAGAKAGKISKPYGLQGSVNMILDPESGKGIEPENPLFINLDGQRVPFFIEDFDPVSKDQAIVKFEFINTVEEARKICGCDAYLEPKSSRSPRETATDYHDLVGHIAHDLKLGSLGTIIEFVPGKMNPVFLVDYRGKELIIPAVNEIIDHIDSKAQSVYFELPEGLTEL